MAKLYAIAFGEKDKFHGLDLTDGRGSVEWTTVVWNCGLGPPTLNYIVELVCGARENTA
jgi:hypothetical protein